MTIPNSTTEAGVTEAEIAEAYAALTPVLHIDHSHGNKVAAIRRALEAFAQSRQASAQGVERVEPAAIVVRDAEGGSWSEFDNEYDADEFYIRNRGRLIKPQVLFCYEAPLATPPATSGMKEAEPVCYVDAELYRDMLRPDFGSATGVAVSKKSNGEDVALFATPPNQDSLVRDAERPSNAVLVPCDKLAELQKDAERYCYLADSAECVWPVIVDSENQNTGRRTLDKHIDAAIRAGRKG